MYYNYAYNKEGLLESKSACGKTLLKYTYDKNNNIKTIQDITGKSSKYTYDESNRVKTIQDDKEEIQAKYEYYNNDNIKSVTLGNKVKSDYTYDGDGNVQSLVTVTSAGKVLVNYKYAYDINGNRLQKVSSKHKNYYSYDSMNRLVDSSYDDICERFTYDKVGNRLTKSTNNITEKYVYNVKNQLKKLQKENSEILFTYDKQGNTIKEETNTGNNIFEYNTLNKSVKAITKEGNTLVNRYDAEGLRYEIYENEKLSKFIFHKGNVLVETDKDDNVVSRFTRGYDIVAADVIDKDEDLRKNENSNSQLESKYNRYFYSVDEQGSTAFITDKNQKVQNEYYYDAFGNVLSSKEEINNKITYTGQQFDGITKQYYLRARFYNPFVGRFTQEDIYRNDGLNLYAYCKSNPVGYYDPSGYACESKGRAVADGTQEVREAESSLGNVTTSPWLNDNRIGVTSHLESFRDGGSYVMTKDQYMNFVKGKELLGYPDNLLFIARKDFMDKVFSEANSNMSLFEKRLGFSEGHFADGGGLVRIDVKNPLLHNVRMPSGMEMGANEWFKWGGYTSGGVPEAVIDRVPNTDAFRNITFYDK